MYKLQVQLGLVSVLCVLIFCVFVSLGWVLFFHMLVVFSLCKSPGPDVLLSWLVLGVQLICFIFFAVSVFVHRTVFVVKEA